MASFPESVHINITFSHLRSKEHMRTYNLRAAGLRAKRIHVYTSANDKCLCYNYYVTLSSGRLKAMQARNR